LLQNSILKDLLCRLCVPTYILDTTFSFALVRKKFCKSSNSWCFCLYIRLICSKLLIVIFWTNVSCSLVIKFLHCSSLFYNVHCITHMYVKEVIFYWNICTYHNCLKEVYINFNWCGIVVCYLLQYTASCWMDIKLHRSNTDDFWLLYLVFKSVDQTACCPFVTLKICRMFHLYWKTKVVGFFSLFLHSGHIQSNKLNKNADLQGIRKQLISIRNNVNQLLDQLTIEPSASVSTNIQEDPTKILSSGMCMFCFLLNWVMMFCYIFCIGIFVSL